MLTKGSCLLLSFDVGLQLLGVGGMGCAIPFRGSEKASRISKDLLQCGDS